MTKLTFFFFILFAFVSFSNLNAQNCQCVQYVENRTGLGAGGNAGKWGPHLLRNGFSQVTTPQNKDVVVITAGSSNGMNAAGQQYGHIGLVASTETNSKGELVLNIVGANQSQSREWSEYSCSNVSVMKYTVTATRKQYVSYYRGKIISR
jgi:surface antigen